MEKIFLTINQVLGWIFNFEIGAVRAIKEDKNCELKKPQISLRVNQAIWKTLIQRKEQLILIIYLK